MKSVKLAVENASCKQNSSMPNLPKEFPLRKQQYLSILHTRKQDESVKTTNWNFIMAVLVLRI